MMVGSGLEEYTDSQDEIQLEPLPNPSHNLPLDKEGLIPEDVLRELGRSLGSSSQLEASPDYNMRKERFDALLRTLLRTASSARLSPSHKTAAYNALAAYLNQYCLMSMPKPSDFVLTPEIWMEAFEIFLTRTENSKTKPMRQMLVTLVKILSSEHVGKYRSTLISNVASKTIRLIFAEASSSSVKSAFQSLDYFLTKRLICIPDIFSTVSQVKQWELVFEPSNEENQFAKPLTIFSWEALQRAEIMRHVNEIFFNTVQWIRYPDVMLTVGHFISTFFTLVREWCQYSNPSAWTDMDGLPMWVSLVRMSLKIQPELFEKFGLYIIPGLLRMDSTDTAQFLNQLPLNELQKGKFITHPATDIKMSLITARIATEKPFSKVIRLTNPQNIGLSLLFHGDPLIRIRAFELATKFSSQKEPYKQEVLISLKAALPYFHTEPTPKIRDNFLSLMKRAWTRFISSFVDNETLRSQNEINKTSMIDTICAKADKLEVEPSQTVSDRYSTFASWYLCFLIDELQPSASYQRHITALSMMKFILEESSAGPSLNSQSSPGPTPDMIRTPILGRRNLRLLFDLIMDPFEDVRQLAASVLELYSSLVHGFKLPENLGYQSNLEDAKNSDFLENDFLLFENYLTLELTRAARLMQKTGRADHSDGFGRLCEFVAGQRCSSYAESSANKSLVKPLLIDLDRGTQIAGRNIYQAIESAPIPGYLIALRLIIVRETRHEASSEFESISLVEYLDLVSQILRVCTSVWHSVKDVLCFDAPEGYEYDADEGNEAMIGTKDILSYCWRALKESSLLLQAVITCTPKSKIGRSLRHNDYRQIGELFLLELSQLRHRGAFSSVSLAFAACCVQCVRTGDISTRKLPKEWFQEALAFIEKLSSALTRRSAGLPAMVTGILSAYVEGEFFDHVNLELRRIASQSIERAGDQSFLYLPQVHALNCLKDIFIDSKFSTSTEGHISKTLDIAVNCLDSDIWALRNSGLMLLKALVNRLNGGTDIASTKASSSRRQLSSSLYAKYKNLPDLLMKLFHPPIHALHLIEKDKGTTFQVQRVFPALEIVERLGVPNQYEREIKHELWQYIEGPVWPIRDKAAKATSAICPKRDIPAEVRRVLDAPWSTQNSLHGRLLYVRHLSSRIGEAQGSTSNDVWGNLLSQLLKVFNEMVVSNRCPITRAAYLADVAYVLEKLPESVRHSSEVGTSGLAADFILSSLPSTTRRTIIDIWRDFQGYLDVQKSSGPASSLEHEAIIQCSELIQQSPCSERLDSLSRQTVHHENGTIFTEPENPANSDEALRQTGSFLAARLSHTPRSTQVSRQVACWIQSFVFAQDKDSEFPTRKAAIDSILNFISRYPCNEHSLTSMPESLGLCLAVYDSLMDDDDEIRDQGAIVVSILFLRDKSTTQDGGLEESLSAPAARPKLLQYLMEHYSTSMDLWTEAAYRIVGVDTLVRLIGNKKRTCSFLDSAQDRLQKVNRENSSLFVEEKQNLFVDEAQEAATWLNVLMNLKVSNVDALLSAELLRWTVKGIKVLIEAVETDVDGPLGWTSKPDTFVVGMRFILTAQAIIHLSDRGTLQDNVETLRKLLRQLLDIGQKRVFCLHPIWISAVESALGIGPNPRLI